MLFRTGTWKNPIHDVDLSIALNSRRSFRLHGPTLFSKTPRMKRIPLVAVAALLPLFSPLANAQCLKPDYAPKAYEVLTSDGSLEVQFSEPQKSPTDLVIMAGIGLGGLAGASAGGESGAIVGGIVGAIPGAVYGISGAAERKQAYRKFVLWTLINPNTIGTATPEMELLLREANDSRTQMESLVAERVSQLGIQLFRPISLQEISVAANKLNESQSVCRVKKDGTRKVYSPKKLAELIVDEIL